MIPQERKLFDTRQLGGGETINKITEENIYVLFDNSPRIFPSADAFEIDYLNLI